MGLNRLMGFHPSPFDYWISDNHRDIRLVTSLFLIDNWISDNPRDIRLVTSLFLIDNWISDNHRDIRLVTSPFLISSPGPKVQVNYCHHLASVVCRLSSVVCRLSSVVCKLFTFQASSPKPLGRLEPNLAGMFLGWSSTKLLFFVPVGYSIWLPGPIICSDWLKFQRSSSPKLMN